MRISDPKWLCFYFGICTLTSSVISTKPLVPIYEWTQVDYDYRSDQDRQRDINDGTFIPGTPVIIDTDVYYSNKKSQIFVTTPRFQNGTPATLGEVINDKYRNEHIIKPYPSWSWHRNPRQCLRNRLIAVYRMHIDNCGRMWVLDTGMYLGKSLCTPQLIAFDLRTNEVVFRQEIPNDQYEPRSIFVTLIVDVRDTCEDTFVYAADCQGYSIVVFDISRQTSWKVQDKTMYPYPNAGTYNILGDSFELMDGILGMSLTPYVPGRDRKLFYHAMSSNTENWVFTSVLRNETRFKDNPQSSFNSFQTYRGTRRSQSAGTAIDRNGIMYFGIIGDVTFNCWDTSTDYGLNNIKLINDNRTTMQFPTGVKVVDNKQGGQELFVVTCRLQKTMTGTVDTNEINYRILVAKIDQDLIDKCKSKKQNSNYGLLKPPFNIFKTTTELSNFTFQ